MKLEDFYIDDKPYPHNDVIWVECIAQIRKNETGEIRESYEECIWDEETDCVSTWIWSEGNYSCDCNRAMFFNDEGSDCSIRKYSVNLLNARTREIIYKEFS